MRHSAPHRRIRRGGAAIVVLVVFVGIALIVGSTIRLLVTEQRILRGERNQAQAIWLAEAGIERAAAQLARNAEYAGETWQIDADELGGLDGATVTIRVEMPPSDLNVRQITAEAVFPAGQHLASRQQRAAVWHLQSRGQE